MSYSLSVIRWRRVLVSAVAVVALSFVIVMVVITVYALALAFQTRGAPDQHAINLFAARISRKLMPWLELLLTLIIALIVARRAREERLSHGLFIGILAGALSLTVTLIFAGRLGMRNVAFFLITVALGSLGGFIGRQLPGRT